MRLRLQAALAFCLLPALGCHSAYVDAVVRNQTEQPLSVVEVDYPSASFGTQTLMPGGSYHYRFKVLGTDKLKVTWTDNAHHDQHATGPELREGDEGSLKITIAPGGVQWESKLRNHDGVK